MDMTPTQIVEVLQSHVAGDTELVEKSHVEDLVEVNSGYLNVWMGGSPTIQVYTVPKVLGGVYGIAATRKVLDLKGLSGIVGEVADAGYVPSVHGDEHAHPAPMGCGFFKLWSQRQPTRIRTASV